MEEARQAYISAQNILEGHQTPIIFVKDEVKDDDDQTMATQLVLDDLCAISEEEPPAAATPPDSSPGSTEEDELGAVFAASAPPFILGGDEPETLEIECSEPCQYNPYGECCSYDPYEDAELSELLSDLELLSGPDPKRRKLETYSDDALKLNHLRNLKMNLWGVWLQR